jgi:hypothetical protein
LCSAEHYLKGRYTLPVQFRLSASDERFYSPDRDLAYCASNLIKRAIVGLDPDKQEPWVVKSIQDNNISLESLSDAAKALATYINNTLTDPQYKQPLDSLEAAGFFKLPLPVQQLVCAKVGQVFLSAIFPSIRDVIRDPHKPAYKIEDLGAIAACTADKIRRYTSMYSWLKPIYRMYWHLKSKLGL